MAGIFSASFNPASLSVVNVGCGAIAGSVAGTGVHTLSYHTQQDAVVSTGTGIAASAVAATAAAPFRRVLTLMQTQHANPRLEKKFTPHASSRFSFTWMRCVKNVAQKQGVRSFWRGNCAFCFLIPVETVGTLVLQDRIAGRVRGVLAPRSSEGRLVGFANWLVDLFATCTAATVIGSFTYPLTVCSTRLMADVGGTSLGGREFTGLFAGERPALWRIFQAEKTVRGPNELPIFGAEGGESLLRGFKGLYRGLPLHIAHIVPYTTSMLWLSRLFDPIAEPINHGFEAIDLEYPVGDFLAAQLSVLGATAFAYPLKIGSLRMQMQAAQDGGPLYTTAYRCARTVWAQEGFRGFYRGVGVQLPLLPAGALALMLFNAVKDETEGLETWEAGVISTGAGMGVAAFWASFA